MADARDPRCTFANLPDDPPRVCDFERLLRLVSSDAHGCVHVLVRSQSARRPSAHLKCHSCSRELPPGSLFQLDDGVYVVSPELSFVQMACLLPLEHAAHYGMMLCGRYARRAYKAGDAVRSGAGLSGRRLVERPSALTTKDELGSYVKSLSWVRGGRAALRALPHVVENSRSPMESALTLSLCLPYAYGGLSLSHPTLNQAVYLNRDSALAGGVRWDAMGKPYLECDLVWDDARLIVEYHGDESHFTRQGVAKDARKANVLASLGYAYCVATLDTLSSPLKFRELARRVRLRLGRAFRPSSAGFEERNARLLALLRRDYLRAFEEADRSR